MCPDGFKYCEATTQCEPESLDEAVCCGKDQQFCPKTQLCEEKSVAMFQCGN